MELLRRDGGVMASTGMGHVLSLGAKALPSRISACSTLKSAVLPRGEGDHPMCQAGMSICGKVRDRRLCRSPHRRQVPKRSSVAVITATRNPPEFSFRRSH